jgi:hypothetical protein
MMRSKKENVTWGSEFRRGMRPAVPLVVESEHFVAFPQLLLQVKTVGIRDDDLHVEMVLSVVTLPVPEEQP